MFLQFTLLFICIIFSYLIGAIPTGYIIGKIKGIDIRKEGSGNIGATNTLRVLGPIFGAIVLFIDISKSFLTLIILKNIYLLININLVPQNYFLILCAFFILIGNIFNPFLKFKGGKGVATTVGIFLFLNSFIVLIGLLIFVLTVILTKYVSLGSIISSFAVSLLSIFLFKDIFLIIFTFLVFFIILWRHKENIKRLINGKENKIKFSKK
ncbi:MAG: glycerol-3-phosphate 1-O-acyltransferase PlsY [Spirochaetes bacterium]|nr:glycerol-3-phosphate 1-O-acyltransferase PlsY [Spirochaetota bacterium]